MKKLLLIALGSGLWLCAGAQSSNSQAVSLRQSRNSVRVNRNDGQSVANTSFYKQGTQSRNNDGRNARALATGMVIATAHNAFGTYDASTTAVTATQATTPEMICMTHRCNMGDFAAYGSGVYEPTFSLNGGNTWDSTAFALFRNVSARYPNGVISNPKGNTDPMKAYLAVSGPVTNGSNWVATVYGSMRFDTANRNENQWTNGNVGVDPQTTGNMSYMTACDDGRVHVIGAGYTTGNTWLGAVLTTGKYNGTNFTWTQQIIRPHLWDGFKGATAASPYDSLGENIGGPGIAWSQDGKTGYVVIFGNLDSVVGPLNLDFGSYQPIVYKSIDSGLTWTMMPMYNFANLPNLVKYLQDRPTADSGRPFPLWGLIGQAQGDENDYDMVVDMNGNLHIVGSVTSAYYAQPDSQVNIYTWTNPRYYIYDVYTTTPTGGWQARFIDSMLCRPSYSVVTGPWLSNGTNQVNFGARIQTTRTAGGDKIFYTWTDEITPGNPDSAGMQYPDIKAMGYDVQHNTQTAVTRFTSSGDQYYICVSDKALVSGTYPNSIDSIPVVYVASPANNDGTFPIEFRYQAGVVWKDADFVGFNEVKAPVAFSVSNNYPNPFNNTTQFNINLDKESTVAVDVYNMLGERIESIAPAKMAAGTHVVTLGGKGMNTGVYFYRVTVGDQAVTHKMIVE